jgi:hypothetical protein
MRKARIVINRLTPRGEREQGEEDSSSNTIEEEEQVVSNTCSQGHTSFHCSLQHLHACTGCGKPHAPLYWVSINRADIEGGLDH